MSATARRALTLLFSGPRAGRAECRRRLLPHVQLLASWRDVSANAPREESVHGRLLPHPRSAIILLLIYDRMPKKEVKFTRHNILSETRTCANIAVASLTGRI